MDAKTLYEQGISAIRDQQDREAGRKLLTQALKLDPRNDMAWLWLSRALDEPAKQRQAVERALHINPHNTKARDIYLKLVELYGGDPTLPDTLARSVERNGSGAASIGGQPAVRRQPTPQEAQTIARQLKIANDVMTRGDDEGAVEAWVNVLNIVPDHDLAIKSAVQTLVRLNFYDDAKELVNRAIAARTPNPAIYLTAMDFAKRDRDHARLEALREAVLRLPDVPESLVIKIAEDYLRLGQNARAREVLETGVKRFPDSQRVLFYMGETLYQSGFPRESAAYFNRAAKIDPSTKEGKASDKRLMEFPPVLSDRERGNLLLAWREAFGIGAFLMLLAWMDAGLNLGNLSSGAALGVFLSVLAGYLLVTATSSPQQRPIARLLGGRVPEDRAEHNHERAGLFMASQTNIGAMHEPTRLPILPAPVRVVFALFGIALLIVAFLLVFDRSIDLLGDPGPTEWRRFM
jgi:tetratricopeptide (TPR) repeat protein